MRQEMRVRKIQSVDVMRAIAIFAVIVLHTKPFRSQSPPAGSTLDLATTINQLARFAVPFFFVISGYFWANKIKGGTEILSPTLVRAKRICYMFLAWSAIYLLPWNIYDSLRYGPTGPIKGIYWNICNAITDPLTTVMEGTKSHLWFLVGLLCSLLVSALFIRLRQLRLLIVLALVFYTIALLGKPYSCSVLGFHVNFNFRNGPFFSLIFFVTGYLLQCKQPDDSWFRTGLLISMFGIALHFFELMILSKHWGTTMLQDYVVGTYFFGTGVAIMALSNCKIFIFEKIASIGQFVLGIYVSHYIFVDLLKPIGRKYSGYAMWELSYPALVLLLSYMFVLLIARLPLTKKLIY